LILYGPNLCCVCPRLKPRKFARSRQNPGYSSPGWFINAHAMHQAFIVLRMLRKKWVWNIVLVPPIYAGHSKITYFQCPHATKAAEPLWRGSACPVWRPSLSAIHCSPILKRASVVITGRRYQPSGIGAPESSAIHRM
jgi:hypothetical protein